MDVKAKKLRREGFVTGNLFGRALKFTKKEIGSSVEEQQ